jgi:hypothetical protein
LNIEREVKVPEISTGNEQQLPLYVILGPMAALFEHLNKMEQVYGKEEAMRLYFMVYDQVRKGRYGADCMSHYDESRK